MRHCDSADMQMCIFVQFNENIMLGSQTESHYCNMFSCHLPHTVLFVSCDVFHIVVAVGYSQKGKKKKQTKKNILTKHGQSIHKSPWQMWKFEITMVVLKPGCQ